MLDQSKKIVPYFASSFAKKPDHYEILIPVYYMNDPSPAWRRAFRGTEAECKELFGSMADYYTE